MTQPVGVKKHIHPSETTLSPHMTRIPQSFIKVCASKRFNWKKVAVSGQVSDGSEEFYSLSRMTWQTFLLTEYKSGLSAKSQQRPLTVDERTSLQSNAPFLGRLHILPRLLHEPLSYVHRPVNLSGWSDISAQHGCYVDPETGLSPPLPPANSHGLQPPPSQPRRLCTSWHIYLF